MQNRYFRRSYSLSFSFGTGLLQGFANRLDHTFESR